MKKITNLRSLAAQLIEQVIDKHQSLSAILPPAQKGLSSKDSALLQELCFGVTRFLPQLDSLINRLMEKPMTGKQRVIHYLLMVGIYQLVHTRIPAHAALAETVDGASVLKRQQLKGLVNGVLRQFQRRQGELLSNLSGEAITWLHPSWIINRVRHDWPDHWQQVLNANNQRPPMWLRVNRSKNSRTQWLEKLADSEQIGEVSLDAEDAVRLDKPAAVTQLPGFEEGWVTVQDLSAQRCALFLAPEDGENILDLCAAPGGKTTHILEIAPNSKVTAVDIDQGRLQRVKENLQRLQMQATVIQGDGRYPERWSPETQYDKILLDAPCSATGVIRRHPDIKWLRRDSDIAELAKLQREILQAIWSYLKPGGTLVYATCSIMREENSSQIAAFLTGHPDAQPAPLAPNLPSELQVLPEELGGDGFFYAKLVKIFTKQLSNG